MYRSLDIPNHMTMNNRNPFDYQHQQYPKDSKSSCERLPSTFYDELSNSNLYYGSKRLPSIFYDELNLILCKTSLSKALITAVVERKKWQQELCRFLLQYRTTPHSTTKVPPSELLFNKTVRGALPTLNPRIIVNRHQEAKEKAQIYNKSYADLHHHARESLVKVGDTVLVQQEKKQKLIPKFKTTPYQVVACKGTTVVAETKKNTG